MRGSVKPGCIFSNLFESLPTAREFLRNGFDGSLPDERCRILIPSRQEFLDGFLKIFHAAERVAADSRAGQLAKPPLDQIEPTGIRRHKVRNNGNDPLTRIALGDVCGCHGCPSLCAKASRRGTADPETARISRIPGGDAVESTVLYASLQYFQSSEQGCCSIAFVVVPHGTATTLHNRQARLRSVQRLDLAFFIHTQNDRLLRRVQVQAPDMPDVADSGFTNFRALRHQPTTPMCQAFGLGAQGCSHNRFDLFRTVGGLASAPRGHFSQSTQAFPVKAGTPQNDSVTIYPQILSDGAVGLS